jgi:hypothetical protein
LGLVQSSNYREREDPPDMSYVTDTLNREAGEPYNNLVFKTDKAVGLRRSCLRNAFCLALQNHPFEYKMCQLGNLKEQGFLTQAPVDRSRK